MKELRRRAGGHGSSRPSTCGREPQCVAGQVNHTGLDRRKLRRGARGTSISTGPRQHRLRARPVARVLAVTPSRIVLLIAKMPDHLPRVQRGLEHVLGQLVLKPASANQLDVPQP